MDSNIKNITIFGCGFMGSGIAQVFASKGFKVIGTSVDPKELEALASTIESNMRVMFEKGICTEQDIKDTLSNITTTSDVELAVKDADLVIESIVENMEIKQDLFEKLDGICKPETILATNTSVMSITEIGSKYKNRHRVVGTHFWNPPFLIPLVEVIKTEFVSDDTIDKVFNS